MQKKRVSAAAVALAALVATPVAGAAGGLFTSEPAGSIAASEAEFVSSVDATAPEAERDGDEEAELEEAEGADDLDGGEAPDSDADARDAVEADITGGHGADDAGGVDLADDSADADASAPGVEADVDGEAPVLAVDPDADEDAGGDSAFGIDPVVDLTSPVIAAASFGPVSGEETFTLTQDEADPGRSYVEIQQLVDGKWKKYAGQQFVGTNEFVFVVDTDALDETKATQLKLSTWDASGNHASRTFPVQVDHTKPVATLVTPTEGAPTSDSTLDIRLDASDEHGLHRITANIYQDGQLVRSTSSSASGAQTGTHAASVDLPDGEYVIRYNASDLAGNVSQTGSFAVEIDSTAPTLTVKQGASVVNGIYATVPSFTLQDAGQGEIDYVLVNGTMHDRANAKWSDLNAQNYAAVQGENTVQLFDTAGNSTSFTFVLDSVAPVIAVKDGATEVNGVYTSVPSFKLSDAGIGQVDYVEVNGRIHDRTNAKWSDLNAGDYAAAQGANTITVVDTAGNRTDFGFELDTVLPEVVGATQTYEPKDGGRTVVTLTFSEAIDPASLGQGWYGDGATFRKAFYREREITVNFRDLVGHAGSYVFTVQAPGSTDGAAETDSGAAVDDAAIVGTITAEQTADVPAEVGESVETDTPIEDPLH